MARLPYETDRPDDRPFIFEPRDWNSTPRDIGESREMRKILDDVARLTANEIGHEANKNVLRTFHYNMMSRSNFRNSDFERLIRFVTDFLESMYRSGKIRYLDDRLEENIGIAVGLHMAKQIDDFPELEDELRREKGEPGVRSALATARKFFEVAEAIANMEGDDDDRGGRGYHRDDRGRDDRGGRGYRGNERGVRSQYRDSRDDRGYRGDRGRYREERVVSGRDVAEESTSERGARHTPNHNEISARFIPEDDPRLQQHGSRQSHHIRHEDSSGGTNGRFSADEPHVRKRGFTPSSEFQAQEDVSRDQGSFDFTPPKFVPENTVDVVLPSTPPPPPPSMPAPAAPPAPPPEPVYTGKARMAVHKRKPILEPIQRIKKDDMNIEQHAAVYPEGSEAGDAILEEAERLLTLETAVTHPTVTPAQIGDSIVIEPNITIHESVQGMALDVSDAATETMIIDSGENAEGVRQIQHSYAVVSNSIKGFPILVELQRKFEQAKNLKDIVDVLKNTEQILRKNVAASAAMASDARAAVARLDRMITKEINIFCREVLKISDGNVIDSAVNTLDELVDAVKTSEEYDDCVYQALTVFLSDLSASILETFNPKLGIVKSIKATPEPEEGQEVPETATTALPMIYLVTHLPFTAGELGLPSTVTGSLEETRISQFVKAALDTVVPETNEFSAPARLLVTRDAVAYRVYTYPGRKEVLVLVPVPI